MEISDYEIALDKTLKFLETVRPSVVLKHKNAEEQSLYRKLGTDALKAAAHCDKRTMFLLASIGRYATACDNLPYMGDEMEEFLAQESPKNVVEMIILLAKLNAYYDFAPSNELQSLIDRATEKLKKLGQ